MHRVCLMRDDEVPSQIWKEWLMDWTSIEKKWNEMALRLRSANGVGHAVNLPEPIDQTSSKSVEKSTPGPTGDARSGDHSSVTMRLSA